MVYRKCLSIRFLTFDQKRFHNLEILRSAKNSAMDEPVASSSTENLPTKRIRKATDKEFKVSTQQFAKHAKIKHNNKEKQKAQVAAVPYSIAPPKLNMFIAPSVALSAYDKATQLTLSKDQLLCYGCEVFVVL